jgi:hypothetical protein
MKAIGTDAITIGINILRLKCPALQKLMLAMLETITLRTRAEGLVVATGTEKRAMTAR